MPGSHNAVIHDFVGPMVVMAFGILKAAMFTPSAHMELVTDLQAQLDKDVKIVHGAANGDFGLFGGNKRCSFTFTFPGFEKALGTLVRLDFGQTEELPT